MEEEHDRREQERKYQQGKWIVEPEWRVDDAYRHNQLMQMIMMIICKVNSTDMPKWVLLEKVFLYV